MLAIRWNMGENLDSGARALDSWIGHLPDNLRVHEWTEFVQKKMLEDYGGVLTFLGPNAQVEVQFGRHDVMLRLILEWG